MSRLARLVPAAAFVVLAACSDSLSPDTVDPSALGADFESVASTFGNNAAFQSLASLSQHFPDYAGTPLVEASLSAIRAPRRPINAQLAARLAGPRDIQALFPANVLGKTLEWNTTTDEYEVGTQTGAPATGIRVLIYVVNPATEAPVEPLQQLGYVDLTDESTAAYDRVGVLLRLLGNTMADYDVTLIGGTTSVELRAQGRLSSVTLDRHADFDLRLILSLVPLEVSIIQDVTGSDGTRIHLDLTGSDSTGTLAFSVGRGENTIAIEGDLGPTTVDAVVKYNGTVVATITGDQAAPVITAADGRPLPASHVAALVVIFGTALDFLSDLTDGVFGPAAVVF